MRTCSRQWFTVRRFSTGPRRSAERAVADLTHGEVDEKVKIVAVTSCAGGIAHTYMAAEALQKAAKTAGDEIKVEIPEFTSVCPKTGLPDFGKITIRYVPDRWCVELKSLKMYMLGYRDLGIFYENAVNRILKDVVRACKPVRASVTGEFKPRGGISSVIEATYPRAKK